MKRDNPQAYRVYDPNGLAPTLSTMQGGGREPYIIENYNDGNKVVRKLTPRECFRLQGWSDEYFEKAQLFNSNVQLYKQSGNGVTVNIIESVGKNMS